MDFINLKNRIREILRKYKYACVVALAGVLLMVLPDTKKEISNIQENEITENIKVDTVEEQLEQILGYIKGAGQVKVMLAQATGESTLYQTDKTLSRNDSAEDSKVQTVLITDSERNETGLIYQINPPSYLGAVIIAQGADDPCVRLAIVEAVMDITGLGADKISVLTMQ